MKTKRLSDLDSKIELENRIQEIVEEYNFESYLIMFSTKKDSDEKAHFFAAGRGAPEQLANLLLHATLKGTQVIKKDLFQALSIAFQSLAGKVFRSFEDESGS